MTTAGSAFPVTRCGAIHALSSRSLLAPGGASRLKILDSKTHEGCFLPPLGHELRSFALKNEFVFSIVKI
jgi:hypothetical protein